MYKPESVLENGNHKVIRDFDLQTYRSILNVSINKKKRTCDLVNFAALADHRGK